MKARKPVPSSSQDKQQQGQGYLQEAAIQQQELVREVTSKSLLYLVDLPQIDQEQEKWPDQEMMEAVARELDAEIRAEEVASS